MVTICLFFCSNVPSELKRVVPRFAESADLLYMEGFCMYNSGELENLSLHEGCYFIPIEEMYFSLIHS